jgi:hypothetical protein
MWRCRRLAILLAAAVVSAACTPLGEPAGNEATGPNVPGAGATRTGLATPAAGATRSSSPGRASGHPAPAPAADDTATLFVTTQSHRHCPLIAPSLKADCGFLPLPKVRIAITTAAGDVLTGLTGDDGTVRLPVSPGVVGVRGAPVSEDLSRPPLPITVEVVPSQIQPVVLIYENGSRCHLRTDKSARHLLPRTYRAGAGQAVVTRGACP